MERLHNRSRNQSTPRRGTTPQGKGREGKGREVGHPSIVSPGGGMRHCRDCDRALPLDEFYRSTRDGWQNKCKACKRRWNDENRELVRAKQREADERYRRKKGKPRRNPPVDPLTARVRRYGLTVEQFIALRESQDDICAICAQSDERGLVIDHCHKTGVVRGLLCHRCNTGLGLLRDDPEVVLRAAAYLARERSRHLAAGAVPAMDGASGAGIGGGW